jgi:hypothetical protein
VSNRLSQLLDAVEAELKDKQAELKAIDAQINARRQILAELDVRIGDFMGKVKWHDEVFLPAQAKTQEFLKSFEDAA